jgi:hypothetical protein
VKTALPATNDLIRIGRTALVVPDERRWLGQAIGEGSIVRRIEPPKISPLTGSTDEPYIEWVDCVGRTARGWLARTTVLEKAQTKARELTNTRDGDHRLSPVDRLRDLVVSSRKDESSVKSPWTLLTWCSTFGYEHLDVLRDVTRELGGRTPTDEDAQHTIRRALRLILQQEVSMSDVATGATSAPAKTARKSGTKRAAKTTDAPARSMARTASGSAVVALEKAGAPKHLVSLAKKLADNALTKKELVELRDGINTQASTAREAKKGGVATQLSSVNRLVRRIIRKG